MPSLRRNSEILRLISAKLSTPFEMPKVSQATPTGMTV
jgi:hypothetical protein